MIGQRPKNNQLRQSEQPPETDLDRAERALRIVYCVVLPQISEREWAPRLGIAAPSYNRAFVRSHLVFQQLEAELGEWWLRLLYNEQQGDARVRERRTVRPYMEEAALELAEVVSKMPRPVRDVVTRRALGRSWKRILKELEGRAIFSVTDDWEMALRIVAERHGDLVRRLV